MIPPTFRRLLGAAPLLVLPVGCAPQPAMIQPDLPHVAPASVAADLSELERRVRERIAAVPGARVAVSYVDLGSGDTLHLGADTAFHAASTMKVPVLVELVRRAERGELSLDSTVVLRNRFASIVDGSPYELSPGDDSDALLYRRVGTAVSLRELAERMIVRSSNLATNVLIDMLGAARVRATATSLGAPELRVLRGVEDGKAYEKGLSNTTTARSLAALLAAIERGEAAAPAGTAEIRRILLAQEFDSEIPAGLPPGTPVAHKTGSITATLHDAAIVYPRERPAYVLVVLTGNVADPAVARRLIADLSRLVYDRHVARHRAL